MREITRKITFVHRDKSALNIPVVVSLTSEDFDRSFGASERSRASLCFERGGNVKLLPPL